jgi:CRP/FNR family transcriptional regulator, anaerobic regulatory protein
MKEILNYLSQTYWKLTEEAMTYVLQKCDEYSIPEGEILSEDQKVCRHVWFIKKGMLRAYQHNPVDNKKYTNWFMKNGDIATSVISFFNELPSDEEIVAVEDSVVFRMSKKDLFAGIERFPSMAILTLLIVIKYYCDTRFNETFLRMKEPQFIHQRMLVENNRVLQLALQEDIATFLGVTEPTYRLIKSGKYRQEPNKEKPAKPAKSKKK